MLNNETLGKILEYQELDRELIKLEKELAGSEAKKTNLQKSLLVFCFGLGFVVF